MWSYEHIGRHFLTSLKSTCTHFNETDRSYLLPGPHDTDDIFEVMGSKIKITNYIF